MPRRRDHLFGLPLDPRPVVAGAPEAAERAGFDVELAGALQRYRPIVGVAARAAVDAAGPDIVRFRLHVDEHALALARVLGQRIAAQCGAAALDTDVPLGTVAFPLPERQIVRL